MAIKINHRTPQGASGIYNSVASNNGLIYQFINCNRTESKFNFRQVMDQGSAVAAVRMPKSTFDHWFRARWFGVRSVGLLYGIEKNVLDNLEQKQIRAK